MALPESNDISAPQVPVDDASKRSQDVSASTVARMMGLATASDLKLMDSKLDLVLSRIAGIAAKTDKNYQAVQRVATNSDIDRLDLQVGNLKAIVRQLLLALTQNNPTLNEEPAFESAVDALDEK